MIVDCVITRWLSVAALGLTPRERWAGAREFDKTVVDARLFICILGVFLTALTVSSLVRTYKQRSKKSKTCPESFCQAAKRQT